MHVQWILRSTMVMLRQTAGRGGRDHHNNDKRCTRGSCFQQEVNARNGKSRKSARNDTSTPSLKTFFHHTFSLFNKFLTIPQPLSAGTIRVPLLSPFYSLLFGKRVSENSPAFSIKPTTTDDIIKWWCWAWVSYLPSRTMVLVPACRHEILSMFIDIEHVHVSRERSHAYIDMRFCVISHACIRHEILRH
jgi:hypothetical protein